MRDAENRLIRIELAATPQDGSKRVEFAYDYMGRRVEKRLLTWDAAAQPPDWVLTQHRKFVWDGWLLLLELNGLSGDALVKEYTWGQDLSRNFLEEDVLQETALTYAQRLTPKRSARWRRLGLRCYLMAGVCVVATWILSCVAHMGVRYYSDSVYIDRGSLKIHWIVGWRDFVFDNEPIGTYCQWGPMPNWSQIAGELNGIRPGLAAVFGEYLVPQLIESNHIVDGDGVPLGRILRIPLWLVLLAWSAPLCLWFVRKRGGLGAQGSVRREV